MHVRRGAGGGWGAIARTRTENLKTAKEGACVEEFHARDRNIRHPECSVLAHIGVPTPSNLPEEHLHHLQLTKMHVGDRGWPDAAEPVRLLLSGPQASAFHSSLRQGGVTKWLWPKGLRQKRDVPYFWVFHLKSATQISSYCSLLNRQLWAKNAVETSKEPLGDRGTGWKQALSLPAG